MIPDLRKLIKYEEQLGTNEKEDPLITLYRRDTVSSRAKLDDKAKEKEKEILGGKRSPKQPSRADDRTSSKQSYETAFSTASMKRATSEKDMAAVYREKAKANPAGCRPYGRENTGREMIEAFCEQLRLEDEKAKANPNKCRPQRRSRSSSRTKYKDGMPIDIYTDESSPCQGSTWSNRLPLPSTRPVSAASDGRNNSIRIIYFLIY